MIRSRKPLARVFVMTSIVAGGLGIAVAAQESNFVGGTPSQMDATKIRTLRCQLDRHAGHYGIDVPDAGAR